MVTGTAGSSGMAANAAFSEQKLPEASAPGATVIVYIIGYLLGKIELTGENIDDLRDIHGVHIAVLVPFFLDLREKKRVFRDAGGRHFLAEKDKVALIHVRDVVARGEIKTCRGEFVFVSSGMGTAVI